MLLAGFSHDELFRTHMWILFATLAIFTILLMRNADYGLTPKRLTSPPIWTGRSVMASSQRFSGVW